MREPLARSDQIIPDPSLIHDQAQLLSVPIIRKLSSSLPDDDSTRILLGECDPAEHVVPALEDETERDNVLLVFLEVMIPPQVHPCVRL